MTARCCRSCTSTATRSPIPTVLGRMSDDEVRNLFLGYGHEPLFVEGDDPATMHRLMADDAGQRAGRDPRHPDVGARRARDERASEMADDRAAKSQGLDRSEGSRWLEGRRLLARPSGADRQPSRQSEPSGTARAVDAQAISRKRCSTRMAGCAPNCRRLLRSAAVGWAPIRTPMAAC